MIRGLYTSAVGMTTQFKKMDVISNNLANTDTAGFKKDRVISHSFPEELTKKINDRKNGFPAPQNIGTMSLGVYVDEVHTNFSQGSLKQTNEAFDLAIQGAGFFAIQSTDRAGRLIERYTRDGSFTVNEDGRLLTKEGNVVLGQAGSIVVESGDIRIDEQGNIFVDDEWMDQLKIVDFVNPKSLRKYGDNLLDRTQESIEAPFNGQILQGHLESSNVNTVQEMVDMITVMRAYEANQRAVQNHDQTLAKAVNELGKV